MWVLISLFLPLLAYGQTRIKDLPISSQIATNTSVAVDDAAYGTRRVLLSTFAASVGATNIPYATGVLAGKVLTDTNSELPRVYLTETVDALLAGKVETSTPWLTCWR